MGEARSVQILLLGCSWLRRAWATAVPRPRLWLGCPSWPQPALPRPSLRSPQLPRFLVLAGGFKSSLLRCDPRALRASAQQWVPALAQVVTTSPTSGQHCAQAPRGPWPSDLLLRVPAPSGHLKQTLGFWPHSLLRVLCHQRVPARCLLKDEDPRATQDTRHWVGMCTVFWLLRMTLLWTSAGRVWWTSISVSPGRVPNWALRGACASGVARSGRSLV